MVKPRGYWTKERCKIEALKYGNKRDFKKIATVAHWTANKNNWLNEICEHMVQLVPRNYWTKERCEEEVLKYSNKRDLRINNPNLVSVLAKNGWLKELCSHMVENPLDKSDRIIYVYEFNDKSAYIGLTKNIHIRHLQRKNNIKDSVTNYSFKTNLIPILKILEIVDFEFASEKEIYYTNEYFNNGWNILNKVKPGNLGGNTKKWTKEKILESALKYTHKNKWRLSKDSSAYSACKKYYDADFFNECTKHMIKIK